MAIISKAEIINIKEYGQDIKEYTLKLEKNGFFESGTFLLLTLEEKEDYTRWPESRNFSIASTYDKEGLIKLIIRKVGKYTTRIFNELQVGKTCTVKYAFGDFLLPFYDKKNSICCIAGGTGIAPILSFAEDLKATNQQDRLHIYYSFKNNEENMGLDLLTTIIPKDQLHLYSTREKINNCICRRIESEDILDKGFDLKNTHFYICGSESFTECFRNILEGAGAQNVYTDEW